MFVVKMAKRGIPHMKENLSHACEQGQFFL